LHHILLPLLEAQQVQEAVLFASHYKHLVYFSHALEILLHTVVESEATFDSDNESEDGEAAQDGVLPAVVEFLDYFDAALDVVVGCARKTELTRWRRLFSVVGNPKSLFEVRIGVLLAQLILKDRSRCVFHHCGLRPQARTFWFCTTLSN
jgi:RAB6A-GEF complex partner protein 1